MDNGDLVWRLNISSLRTQGLVAILGSAAVAAMARGAGWDQSNPAMYFLVGGVYVSTSVYIVLRNHGIWNN